MINNLYIYISDEFNPYKNLATEKYLMDNVPECSAVLYLWQNQNTVVIGRNQNPWAECNTSLMEKDGIYLARRLSGGGAVFHDTGNLNFTFICNTEDYDIKKHMSVISDACRISGIETTVSGRNDILADGRKFSGNAFYNSRGKSYHHGTILIDADKEKMTKYLTPSKVKLESKGVKSVKARVVNLKELSPEITIDIMKENMIASFENVYGKKAEMFDVSNIKEITDTALHYESREYIYGFRMPFTVSLDGHFDWGNIELCLDVSDGLIRNATVYTDSMDWLISEKVKVALKDTKFDNREISKALSDIDKGEDICSLFP